jgi:hypothetical protein
MRYLTLFFLFLNTLWWILLLVSIFVSPPGLYTRGSGFFDFAFVSLTTGNLLVSLLFFSEPSKAMRVSSSIVAIILLVDCIIILAVGGIRHEEGPVGIASVIWAFFIASWTIVADRVVAAGKREEEVRLTGREEMRRTLKEWLGVLIGTTFLVIFMLISILMTGTLILRARDASLAAPGTRIPIDGGKYSIHLACFGNVSYTSSGARQPALLLEAGEHPAKASLEAWASAAAESSDGTTTSTTTISRYCYWDRPGYGWSDNAPSPHSAGMSATALAEALARADEQGPWIVAAAGYGAIVARVFTSFHTADVVGLLLVDPLHEDLLNRVGNAGRGFKLWGFGIISPLGLERIPGALFKGRTREDRVYGISAGQSGKLIKARLQENLVADSLTKNEILAARTIQEKSMPLVVISSGIECRRDREWETKQEASTRVTENLLDWKVVNGAPHEVWTTSKGRDAMEKGLSKLVKTALK